MLQCLINSEGANGLYNIARPQGQPGQPAVPLERPWTQFGFLENPSPPVKQTNAFLRPRSSHRQRQDSGARHEQREFRNRSRSTKDHNHNVLTTGRPNNKAYGSSGSYTFSGHDMDKETNRTGEFYLSYTQAQSSRPGSGAPRVRRGSARPRSESTSKPPFLQVSSDFAQLCTSQKQKRQKLSPSCQKQKVEQTVWQIDSQLAIACLFPVLSSVLLNFPVFLLHP